MDRYYRLSLEQFKEYIAPFIEEANELIEKITKGKLFKITKIQEIENEFSPRNSKFQIDFEFGDTIGNFEIFIKDGVLISIPFFQSYPVVEFIYFKFFINDRAGNALRAYLYSIYGEDYINYALDYLERQKKYDMRKISTEIENTLSEIKTLEQKKIKQSEQYDKIMEEIKKLSVSNNV